MGPSSCCYLHPSDLHHESRLEYCSVAPDYFGLLYVHLSAKEHCFSYKSNTTTGVDHNKDLLLESQHRPK